MLRVVEEIRRDRALKWFFIVSLFVCLGGQWTFIVATGSGVSPAVQLGSFVLALVWGVVAAGVWTLMFRTMRQWFRSVRRRLG